MNENINESAEIQEVAEPEMEALESEEMQEVAEPAESESSAVEVEQNNGRTEQDAAFAEMRRTNQQLERDNKMMMDALLRYFDGDTAEELSINANAYAEQRDPEEYRQEWEQDQEFESLQAENEDLREQLLSAQAERMMREDLAEIQRIDDSVKSIDDLGEAFLSMRLNGGLSAKEAFYACKAIELKEKVLAPDAIGRVADTKVDRDYYTSEELDRLSEKEIRENWDKVQASLAKL